MDSEPHEELARQIEDARTDEDRAWVLAADVRRRRAPDNEVLGALHLVEATTARRMKLERRYREPK
jgi:hypothetical protein